VIQGNRIDTDVTGAHKLGNTVGVYIGCASQRDPAVIGGAKPGEGNLISGNLHAGVMAWACPSMTIQGNLIGTDASETQALGNGDLGIMLESCDKCVVVTRKGRKVTGS
jgi:hypothetical protein